MIKQENPFDVESIDEFLFYCCPQCDIKCKDWKSFIKHARQIHTQAKEVPLYLPTLDFKDEEMPMSENIESTEFNIEDSDEELSDDELYEQKSNDLSVNSNNEEELSEKLDHLRLFHEQLKPTNWAKQENDNILCPRDGWGC